MHHVREQFRKRDGKGYVHAARMPAVGRRTHASRASASASASGKDHVMTVFLTLAILAVLSITATAVVLTFDIRAETRDDLDRLNSEYAQLLKDMTDV